MLTRFRGRSPTDPNVYRCHWYPVVQASVFSFIAVIGLAGLAKDPTIGGKVFGGVLAGVTSIFAFRAARAGTVVATEDSLVIRNLLRTHRLPYEEIRSVGAETRPVGPMGYRRSCLAIDTRDGRRKVYTEFNSPPSGAKGRAVVEDVAAELDSLVRRRVAGDG